MPEIKTEETFYPPDELEVIERRFNLRHHLEGLAIDDACVKRPEDAIFAKKHKDGSFSFANSIVEVGVLDPDAVSIRLLADSLAEGGKARVLLPPERRNFHFGTNEEMPALTVLGAFRADRGLFDLDIVRSRIQPTRYWHGRKLKRDPVYGDCRELTYAVQKYELGIPGMRFTNQPRKTASISSRDTVATFANLTNIAYARLATEAGIPFIYRNYTDASGKLKPSYDLESIEHQYFPNNHPYAHVTQPLQNMINWVNHVLLSYYMEHGESPVTAQELQLIVNWIDRKPKVLKEAEAA